MYDDSSSDSCKDLEIITMDSDESIGPEIFSDVDSQHENFSVIAEPSIQDFLPGEFVYVKMKTETRTLKEYVAQIKSCENDGTFLCTFLRNSNKISNAYIHPPIEDIGIVEREEIVKKLMKVTILRRGQLRFDELYA